MADSPTSPTPRSPSARPTRAPALDPTVLNAAFDALRIYDAGSSRGSLEPIDTAVLVVLADPQGRHDLERRLAGVLQSPASVWTKEYVCSKLRLIGGSASVKALAALLASEPQLADAARDALQSMASPEADRALHATLSKLTGTPRLGVIDSLGKRRDVESVSSLARFLEHSDETTMLAAAAALGEIGTPRAARALRRHVAACPPAARLQLADACLVCIGRLCAVGRVGEARELGRALETAQYPEHVRASIARALAKAPPSR